MRLKSDSKQALASNVAALLASRPDLPRMDHAKTMGVGDGTIGRIIYGTGNPTLDVLESIAAYFRVQPWQLLLPAEGATAITDSASQPVSGEDLTIAAELADEALRGQWIPKHRYYALVSEILDGMQKGLPYAEILRIITPDARKISSSEVDDDSRSDVGFKDSYDTGRRAAKGNT